MLNKFKGKQHSDDTHGLSLKSKDAAQDMTQSKPMAQCIKTVIYDIEIDTKGQYSCHDRTMVYTEKLH